MKILREYLFTNLLTMKFRILSSFSLPVALVITILSAYATAQSFAMTTVNPQTTAQHLAAIIAKGDLDITARTTSLDNLISKVETAKKLSTDQKSALTADMQTEKTGLLSLKTKLDSDTDVATARIDFQNIFAQHYVYAFYIPRINRIIAADDQSDAVAILIGLTPKFQSYITQVQSQGKSVTLLQSTLVDFQAKTADALSKSDQVITTLTPVTSAGYPGNKTTLQTAASQLLTSRNDLTSARTDAKTLVISLRKLLANVQ